MSKDLAPGKNRSIGLVVFDLDFTMWFPAMDELHNEKIAKDPVTGDVTDAIGWHVHFYPEIHSVLSVLKTDPQFRNTKIGVASRTEEIETAKKVLGLMDVTLRGEDGVGVAKKTLGDIADFVTVFPGSKTTHFKLLKEQSGIEFEDMLFNDDEMENVHDVSALGVVCCTVPKVSQWRRGCKAWRTSSWQEAAERVGDDGVPKARRGLLHRYR
ncbi:Magnesium-dependent phosphatase-1, eukaryotic type [Phytophthora cactorum]|nr:Magnesium-dependent phosphatase-1, eukaryotic type [Phytophthora cactorum]